MGLLPLFQLLGSLGQVRLHRYLSLFAALLGLAVAPASAQEVGGYTLALGDVVSIHVFDEQDLSFSRVAITDTGTIVFPFLGEIAAAGRTTAQVQQAIVNGLKPDYLIDPKVSVSIIEYRPFFLTGQVERPGSIPYQPGLTLRQAVTIAGGFTERASTSRITVVSEGASNSPVRIDMNYLIKPGDTITVAEGFF
jgi:polysaccharide biosynthesis/export protein VpsN